VTQVTCVFNCIHFEELVDVTCSINNLPPFMSFSNILPVNTSARMESTGRGDFIQCSEATAEILKAAGKLHWLHKRDGLVEVKGKGAMQTYWVNTLASLPFGTPTDDASVQDFSVCSV